MQLVSLSSEDMLYNIQLLFVLMQSTNIRCVHQWRQGLSLTMKNQVAIFFFLLRMEWKYSNKSHWRELLQTLETRIKPNPREKNTNHNHPCNTCCNTLLSILNCSAALWARDQVFGLFFLIRVLNPRSFLTKGPYRSKECTFKHSAAFTLFLYLLQKQVLHGCFLCNVRWDFTFTVHSSHIGSMAD